MIEIYILSAILLIGFCVVMHIVWNQTGILFHNLQQNKPKVSKIKDFTEIS